MPSLVPLCMGVVIILTPIKALKEGEPGPDMVGNLDGFTTSSFLHDLLFCTFLQTPSFLYHNSYGAPCNKPTLVYNII